MKSNTKGILDVRNYILIYSQVSPIEKIRCRCEVIIVKERAAVPLQFNSGFMGIQERTSVLDKGTGNGKKEGKYETELLRKSSRCKYIHKDKKGKLPG